MTDFRKEYEEFLTEQADTQSEIEDTEFFFEELKDLYDANQEELTEDEFFEEVAEYFMDDEGEELSESSMDLTQRRKLGRRMKRIARMPKTQMKRERNFKKNKSYAEWQKRGKKAFRRFFKKLLLKKRMGKTMDTATARDKTKVEEILSSPKFLKRFKSKMRKFTISLMKSEKEKKANRRMKKAENKANELLPKKSEKAPEVDAGKKD